jgi:triosephosphate isomerase (TIM)
VIRKPVFAANWKMNHGPTDAKAFIRTFLVHYPRRADRTVAFFPPSLTLAATADVLRDRPDILLGVQNVHWEPKGAFTGEVSPPIARDAGARLVLIGHSERRHVFGETDEQTGLKCGAVVTAGLTPVLCVGEKLQEREHGQAEAVVVRQLRAGFAHLQPAQIANALVAYEPVWAIGTGRTATPKDASAMHLVIRELLKELAGDRAAMIPVLYGGSVSRGNVAELIAAGEVDGVLVGGASLDADGWATIVRA